MLSFEFLLRLSAILKLDFLKSPGKSGSARPPRGMKLANSCFFFLKRQDSLIEKLISTYMHLESNHGTKIFVEWR